VAVFGDSVYARRIGGDGAIASRPHALPASVPSLSCAAEPWPTTAQSCDHCSVSTLPRTLRSACGAAAPVAYTAPYVANVV
jgi:hypothetical protein